MQVLKTSHKTKHSRLQPRYAIPSISAEETTPLVKRLVAMTDGLLEMNQRLSNEVQQMRDEIAVLKGQKAKPKFKSSKMDQNTDKDN